MALSTTRWPLRVPVGTGRAWAAPPWQRRAAFVALALVVAGMHVGLLRHRPAVIGAEARANPPMSGALTVRSSAVTARRDASASRSAGPTEPQARRGGGRASVTPNEPSPPADMAAAAAASSPAAASSADVAGAMPPARVPASERRQFRWQQGTASGSAELDWQHDAGRYVLRFDAPGRWTLRSEGRVDETGLLPERHTERRRPRSERALSIARGVEGEGVLQFSSRSETWPLPPGLQDGISWLVQLVAWQDARSLRSVSATTALPAMPVATTAGDWRAWQFDTVDPPEAGAPLHLVRPPTHAYDTRLELWLDAQPPHWPLRLRWTPARGEALQLDAE